MHLYYQQILFKKYTTHFLQYYLQNTFMNKFSHFYKSQKPQLHSLNSIPQLIIQQNQHILNILAQKLFCSNHNKSIRFICVTPKCAAKKFICQKCLTQLQTIEHLNDGHQIKEVQQIYNELNILYEQRKQMNGIRKLKNVQRIKQFKQKLNQRFQINDKIRILAKNVINELINYENLISTYKFYCQYLFQLKQKQSRQKLTSLITKLSFLKHKCYDAKQIKHIINSKIQIQNSSYNFHPKFQDYLTKCQSHYMIKLNIINQEVSKISIDQFIKNMQKQIEQKLKNNDLTMTTQLDNNLISICVKTIQECENIRSFKIYSNSQLILQFCDETSINNSEKMLQILSKQQFCAINLKIMNSNLKKSKFAFSKLIFPLKMLEINLKNTLISASELQNIAVYFQTFSKSQTFHLLTHFSLILEFNSISSKQINPIKNIIYFLKNITHLKIYLTKNLISQKQAKILCQPISQISNLVAISLLFDGCKTSIQDEGLIQIIKTLTNLANLSQISISVRANKITNKSIEYFADNLFKLKKLKYINLNISNNIKITQKSLMLLIQQIKNSEIEAILLEISFLQISKQYIVWILEMFKKHKTLKLLSIYYKSLWLNTENRTYLYQYADQNYKNSGIDVKLIF